MRTVRDCPQYRVERFGFQSFCSVQLYENNLGPKNIVVITEVSVIQEVR